MKNPIELFFIWFFSQTSVLYIAFVPVLAMSFLIGLLSLTRGRR